MQQTRQDKSQSELYITGSHTLPRRDNTVSRLVLRWYCLSRRGIAHGDPAEGAAAPVRAVGAVVLKIGTLGMRQLETRCGTCVLNAVESVRVASGRPVYPFAGFPAVTWRGSSRCSIATLNPKINQLGDQRSGDNSEPVARPAMALRPPFRLTRRRQAYLGASLDEAGPWPQRALPCGFIDCCIWLAAGFSQHRETHVCTMYICMYC